MAAIAVQPTFYEAGTMPRDVVDKLPRHVKLSLHLWNLMPILNKPRHWQSQTGLFAAAFFLELENFLQEKVCVMP